MYLNLSIPTSYYQLLTPWLKSKIASNKYFFKFLAGDQFCNCLFVYVHHFGKSYFPFSFTYALACLLILICLTGEQFSQLDENKYLKQKKNARVDDLINLLLVIERDFYLNSQRKLHKVQTPRMPKADIDRHKRGCDIPTEDIEISKFVVKHLFIWLNY